MDRKLHILPVYPETEKRDLAPRPVYSLHTPLPQTFAEFDAYWNDHFGGRSLLVNLRAKIWITLFHDSPVKNVIVGKSGWLFYQSEALGDGPGINDYQGLSPFTNTELSEVVDSIKQVNASLMKQGITLIVTAAPNKSTIYPDFLPANFPRLVRSTRMDQLVLALPRDILFVDLRQPLISGRSTLPTYQMTDSHWNNYGAFLATQAVLSRVPTKYHLTPQTIDKYSVRSETIPGEGDLASMMAARGIFSDLAVTIDPKEPLVYDDEDFGYLQGSYSGHIWIQTNKKLPRLLLFGDSFRAAMEPFLMPYFSNSYIMGFTGAHYKLNDDLVKLAKPNIVIWEVAERYLDRLKQ
jgi:hypothetical protein